MTPRPSSRATASGSRRGELRREQLCAAATRLLERLDLPDVSYVAVCKEAGIPTGSAHHFYPDLDAIFRALVARLGAEHDREFYRPLRPAECASWQHIFRCLVRRSAAFSGKHPVFAKLLLGGHTPPDLKRIDREADRSRGSHFLALLEQHFVVPRIADPERVVYLATEIVDLAFMLSMAEAGRITPAWQAHAMAAAEAFMTRHLGESLPVRPPAPGASRRPVRAPRKRR